MKKVLLISLALALPIVVSAKSETKPVTQAEFTALGKQLHAQLISIRNEIPKAFALQQKGLQAGVNKLQANTQKEFTLIEAQIKQLENQQLQLAKVVRQLELKQLQLEKKLTAKRGRGSK